MKRWKSIPWDLDVCRRPDYIQAMLGWIPNSVAGGGVRVCDIIDELDEQVVCLTDMTHLEQTIRNFFLFMLGRTLFSNTGDIILLWCLRALEVTDDIGSYN